jgi:hypothetical protein
VRWSGCWPPFRRHTRLSQAGRLDLDDQPEFGTNVIPVNMSRQELRDGYVQLLSELYEPTAYFDRIEDLFLKAKILQCQAQNRNWRRRPLAGLARQLGLLGRAAGLFVRLLWQVPEEKLRREYLRRLARFIRHRQDPSLIMLFAIKCALHYHFHRLARQLQKQRACPVNTI